MLKLESLLPAAKRLLAATDVIRLAKVPDSLMRDLKRTPRKTPLVAFETAPPLFFLLVDGLNFCFWHPNRHKKFGYKDHGGSVALGHLIKDAMRRMPDFFTPLFMKQFAPALYAVIMEKSRGELRLPDERIRIIKEIGGFLETHDLGAVIQKYRGRDVNACADFLAVHLPYTFGDVSRKNGVRLPFYKKLRLLISDLHELSGIPFKNMDKLLVYADYKLPQVLIRYKVLELSDRVRATIKTGEEIPHDSPEEIALRAATIVAAERIKRATGLSYTEIDYRLWLISKTKKLSFPHHKTVTRYY